MLLYEKRTRVAFDITLLSLAASDLIVSFSLIGYLCDPPNALRFILRHLIYTSGFTSALHLIFIAIQRLIAVRWPLKAAILLTRKRCLVYIFLLWSASLIASVPIISGNDAFYRVYLCTPLAFGSVILLLHVALNFAMKTRKPISSVRANESQNRRVMMYAIAITSVFLICNFPYTLSLMKNTYTRNVPEYTFYLYILHVVCDPVLYFLFHYLKARKPSKSRCKARSGGKPYPGVEHAPVEQKRWAK